jgi:hypothetical protein
VAGAQGIQGEKGEKGDTGSAGPAGASALRVVDASGKEVGTLVSLDAVILNIDSDWMRLGLSGAGFASCAVGAGCVQSEFEQADCAGTAYMSVDSLAPKAFLVGSDIYYPSGAAAVRPVGSLGYDSGACINLDAGFTSQNAERKEAPLSSLGLSGAFHLAK